MEFNFHEVGKIREFTKLKHSRKYVALQYIVFILADFTQIYQYCFYQAQVFFSSY